MQKENFKEFSFSLLHMEKSEHLGKKNNLEFLTKFSHEKHK